jgi:hypothetical protein
VTPASKTSGNHPSTQEIAVSTRPVLALALAASMAVAGGAASAAPKKPKPKVEPPVCNLVVDEKGDDGNEVFRHSDSLDIVGADIASDAKSVTAVIRVAKYLATDSNAAPTGRAWSMEFSVPDAETPLWLGVQVTPTGTLFRHGWVDGTIRRNLGPAEGVIDEAKGELRVTAPVGIWAETGPKGTVPTKGGTVKAGSKVTGLAAASYNFIGAAAAGGSLQPGDTAEGSKSYTAGAPSCVAVGK